MILFATRDAGPAEYLARLIAAFPPRDVLCIASDISKPVFEKHAIPSSEARGFELLKPSLIVTGSCWGEGLDKELLHWAAEKRIPSIGIVEHWSWYRERFLSRKGPCLPGIILVNDTVAVQEAIDAGLPGERLRALGNPLLEDLAQKTRPVFEKHSLHDACGIEHNREIVVFISEEYRKDFPKSSPHFIGFDEFEVLHQIRESLGDSQHLLIKLHPSEPIEKYAEFKIDPKVTVISRFNVDLLINQSDFFIGMGSMLLIEASFCREDIMSYRPNQQVPFIGNKIGASTLIVDKAHLEKALRREMTLHNRKIGDAFLGSKDRIVRFIKEYHP